MPHELFLTTRQETKIKNAFANNMSAVIKLSKTQKSKINQSAGSFCFGLGSLLKKIINKHFYSFGQRQLNWISKQFTFKCNK